MKSARTILAALAAAASLGFASCKPQADDTATAEQDIVKIDVNDLTKQTKVADFYGVMTVPVDGMNGIAQITVSFYTSTFGQLGTQYYKAHYNIVVTGSGGTAARDYDAEIGTYTGDATENGTTLYLKKKQTYDIKQKKWNDVENAQLMSFPIGADGRVTSSSGSTTLTLTRQQS